MGSMFHRGRGSREGDPMKERERNEGTLMRAEWEKPGMYLQKNQETEEREATQIHYNICIFSLRISTLDSHISH